MPANAGVRLRSVSFRLALTYTAAFVLAVMLLGVIILLSTRATLRVQFESRITAESAALAQEYVSEGLEDVVLAVRERDRTPGALDFGFEEADGAPLAGRLAQAKAPLGWSTTRMKADGKAPEEVRILAITLPDGHRLLVGDKLSHVRSLDGVLLRGFSLAIVGVMLLGTAGAYTLSRSVRWRFNEISRVAEAVTEGDFSQRVPILSARDDLDDLGLTFNRMLDRIGALMVSLHQVSNDIAHDLRTPLTRLRQRLESAQFTSEPARRSKAIEEAMTDLDAILETFAALLRIAQIESGARRSAFKPVDLAALARDVVETFAPSAEDEGRSLDLVAPQAALIEGDAELLTQMIVNLIENGLRHTPVGSRIEVSVTAGPDGPSIAVTDDGPGVPAPEQQRIFDRFYRLERSRTTQGNGLGLSLVSAVAKLHNAEIILDPAGRGLRVETRFPIAPPGMLPNPNVRATGPQPELR